MGDEQFCLKWNYHWNNLVGVFNSLLQTETFVDVTLSCEGRRLKAHRLLLSACSPYFTRLLIDNPDRHPVIILRDVRFEHLKAIVHFIYNGEVGVEQKELTALVSLARELQIRGLADERLQEEQLQLAAVQSLSKAAAAESALHVGSSLQEHQAESINSESHASEGFSEKSNSNNHKDEGYKEAKGALSSLQSQRMPINVICLPLPPLALENDLSSDKPTDLTSSSSKLRHRNRSPDAPDAEPRSVAFDDERPQSPKDLRSEGGLSPSRKRQRLSPLEDDEDYRHREYGAVRVRTDVSAVCVTNGESVVSADDSRLMPPGLTSIDELNENEPLALTVESSRPDPRPRLSSSPLSGGTAPPTRPPPPQRDKEDKLLLATHDMLMKEDCDFPLSSLPSGTPSPGGASSSLSATPLPLSSPLGSPNRISGHHLAIIQRALAVGYPLPYLATGLEPPPPPPNSQTPGPFPPPSAVLSPGINSQAKDLIHFLDLFKSLGAGADSALLAALQPAFPALPGAVGAVPPSAAISPSKEADSQYTCHICARRMPSKQFLDEHIKIHEEEKPYKCDHCGQRYKYQSAFQRHQEQNHTAKLPGEKPYRCTVCGQCFKYHKSFLKHRSNHDVLDHIMKNETDDSKPGLHPSYIQCLLNSRLASQSQPIPPTSGLSLVSTSLDSDHRDDNMAPSMKEENVDIDDSTGEQQPETPSSSLPENGEVKDEDIDGDEGDANKFMHCLKCKATFRDIISFEAHCRTSTSACSLDSLREVSVPGENSNHSHPNSGSSSPPASPNRSPGWPTSLNSRSPLAGAAASSPQLQGAILSPSCATTAANSFYSSFTNINLTPATGGSKSSLALGGTPIIVSAAASVCPANACASSLSTSAPGTSKLEDSSSSPAGQGPVDEDRPFKCPYCTKGFKGRENLKLHIRTHTGEKPYNCGVCGKAFGGRSDMNRHLRIHTGEKPYPCKVCGKKFARADYLSKHITTHLGMPFAKPVHSLQQSLQNLETFQNYHNLQNIQKVNNVQSN